jgi:hypothetical protein
MFRPALNIDAAERTSGLSVLVHGSSVPSLIYMRLIDGHLGYFAFQLSTYSELIYKAGRIWKYEISTILDMHFEYLPYEEMSYSGYQLHSFNFISCSLVRIQASSDGQRSLSGVPMDT